MLSVGRLVYVRITHGSAITYKLKVFCADHVFDETTDNPRVYEKSAQRIVRSVAHGYNGQ